MTLTLAKSLLLSVDEEVEAKLKQERQVLDINDIQKETQPRKLSNLLHKERLEPSTQLSLGRTCNTKCPTDHLH